MVGNTYKVGEEQETGRHGKKGDGNATLNEKQKQCDFFSRWISKYAVRACAENGASHLFGKFKVQSACSC